MNCFGEYNTYDECKGCKVTSSCEKKYIKIKMIVLDKLAKSFAEEKQQRVRLLCNQPRVFNKDLDKICDLNEKIILINNYKKGVKL